MTVWEISALDCCAFPFVLSYVRVFHRIKSPSLSLSLESAHIIKELSLLTCSTFEMEIHYPVNPETGSKDHAWLLKVCTAAALTNTISTTKFTESSST